MIEVLKREIEWHQENLGVSGRGLDFENGFIGGLTHARNLLITSGSLSDKVEITERDIQEILDGLRNVLYGDKDD